MAEPEITSRPTLDQPGSMDFTEATCIADLMDGIRVNNSKSNYRKVALVPAGTDPGVKTMFETVVIPEAKLVQLCNRYEILSQYDPDQSEVDPQPKVDPFTPASGERRVDTLGKIIIPDTQCITVKHVRHLSGLNKEAQSRTRALARSENCHVVSAFHELAKQGPHQANTIADLEKAGEVRRKLRDSIVDFEQSRRRRNMSRTKRLRLQRTYDVVAAKERRAFAKTAYGTVI